MTAILRITDGTTTVDLLAPDAGYLLDEWRPSVADYKGGGVWRDSPLADGRRLAMRKRANAVETFRLKARSSSEDRLIQETQDLRRLLEQAADYWQADWATDPVWIEAKASCETNTRYAIVMRGAVPEDDSPYRAPFLQDAGAAMDELELVIERGDWRNVAPGDSDCLEVAGGMYPLTYYLEFNGTSTYIDCGSDPTLDDMPTILGGFTAEAWVRIYPGTSSVRIILSKGNVTAAPTGWSLEWSDADGLRGMVRCAGGNAYSTSGPAYLSDDGAWHHVAMTYDHAGDRTTHLWIDGTERTTTSTVSAGAYSSDAGDTFYHGAIFSALGLFFFWEGDIGWSRVTTVVLYAASFTPPSRCYPPFAGAGFVQGLWPLWEGSGTDAYDFSGNANDGTITDGTWGSEDCAGLAGRSATCEDEVYVANKHNRAHLTHVMYEDNSLAIYSDNLLGTAKPQDLLPNPVAVDDAIYFGCATTMLDSGPFCSLVFDIGTAAVWGAGATGVWEYWNGAWVALTRRDNTNADGAHTGQPFDTEGVKSVHWVQPSDWVANDPGMGVTGFWVRMRVSVIGAGVTTPTQQNRDIYTVLWPYVDIAGLSNQGDLPALLVETLENVCQITAGPYIYPPHRYWFGLRSLSRGEDFTAYINLSDEQNPAGITVGAGTLTPFTAASDTPTGRALIYTTAGAPAEAMDERGYVQFDSPIIDEYRGRYRAFLVVEAEVADRFTVKLEMDVYLSGGRVTVAETGEVLINYGDDEFVADMGLVTMPPSGEGNFYRYYISIQASAALGAGANYLRLIALVLLPVDEWAGDFISRLAGSVHTRQRFFQVDSVLDPKTPLRARLLETGSLVSGREADQWTAIAQPFEADLQTDKRLWMLSAYWYNVGGVNAYMMQHEYCSQVENFERVLRYLSMRGAR